MKNTFLTITALTALTMTPDAGAAKCNDCPVTPHPPTPMTEQQAIHKTHDQVALDIGGIDVTDIYCGIWPDGVWGCEVSVIVNGTNWNAGCLWGNADPDEDGCDYGLGVVGPGE